jgi:hypothetical protein
MIADIWSNILFEDFSIKYDSNSSEKSALDSFLKMNNFSELLSHIVRDTIVYGDCFIRYEKTAKGEVLLEKIEIADMQIDVHAKGFDYLFDFKDENGSTIKSNNTIHFQPQSFMPPFGDSVYGYWFHVWNNIREHFKMLGLFGYQERNIRNYDALNKMRQMMERETILGSGLAMAIFNRYLADKPVTQFDIRFLDSDAKRRRESIQDTVERKIFPLVINRKWEWESNFPRLIIKGKLNLDDTESTNTTEF